MSVINWSAFVKPSTEKTLITIGGFDGVHVGHQKILHTMLKYKEKYSKTRVLVVTFNPLPRQFFKPNTQPLVSLSQRVEKLYKHGADEVIVLPFSENLTLYSAEAFLTDFLISHLNIHTLFFGPQHSFGYNNEGNTVFTKKLSKKLNFNVQEVDSAIIDKEWVSSSLIRSYKEKNNTEKVLQLLG